MHIKKNIIFNKSHNDYILIKYILVLMLAKSSFISNSNLMIQFRFIIFLAFKM